MQCERLLQLAKQWYLHVKEETMAPARMVQFIKQHVTTCPVCQNDPDIQEEIERITDIILPESKIPKAVRMKQEAEEAEHHAEEKDIVEENGEKSDKNGDTELSEEEDEVDPLTPDAEDT